MATKRFTIEGYGQIELNNVAFRRDGRIETQCHLDATDFATEITNDFGLWFAEIVVSAMKNHPDKKINLFCYFNNCYCKRRICFNENNILR